MLYPQYFIDDLKNRADIVRIIQPYAELKKKGSNWMACCPFHQEKTPSFSVNPSKGFYKCFGCGKGGSVYNFLMEIEGLNFPEAIKRVAEITGVQLPEPVDDEQYQRSKKRVEEKKKISEQVIELNKIALSFWESELLKKNAQAKAAREYLKSRGITEDVQNAFRVGFAPDSWDSLLNLLRESKADEKLIEQSGLVSVNEEKDRIFDRFRGRIIFPVLDINGNPVAFGARALGNDQPKYLNSPETPAYVKGQHLYGLFQSKSEIRKKKFAILVEGYLDLIALFQFGIKNVVASLGTAFTPEQSKLLSRLSKKIVINYDGDVAGIHAARRAVEILLEQDFEIKVLVLPEGKDPDDFIRAKGADAYNDARGKAIPYLQFVMDSAVRDRNLTVAKQKAEAIEEVLPVIAGLKNTIQKRESFDQAMNFFRVNDTVLRRELWNAVRRDGTGENRSVKQQVARATKVRMTVAEQHLLELLVYDAELRSVVLPLLEETDYEALATASIFRALFALEAKNEEPTHENLLELVGDDEAAADHVPLLLMSEPKRAEGEAIDQVLHEAENCVFALRAMAVANHINAVTQELIQAELSGDQELIERLVREKIDLGRIELELRQKIKEI
jgi:DNA primase